MKIVFLDRKTIGYDIDISKFETLGDLTIYDTTNEDETLDRVKTADIVITNKVVIDKKIMENSNLKLICITATGTDNIDLKFAKEKGIVVKNVAGYSTASVSQVTFAHVFHFVQKLNYYIDYVKKGNWGESDIFTHIDKPFYELKNKNWGIIGLGEIGTKVATIAKSFGCNVSYYSTSGRNSNTDFKQKSLEDLLEESDIVTIHAPLNDSTFNLINKSNLNLLKDGAILVNVGRGGIINEKDLADAIDGDKVLFCGLDVVSKEPILKTNPLNFVQNKDRLIITPHIAWGSTEARNRVMNLVFDNIQEYIV